MTLQALRVKLGDDTFLPLLRDWHTAKKYGSTTVEEFTAFASARTDRDLTTFFDVWLYQEGKPTTW